MKKKIFMILTMILLIAMTGCGAEKTANESATNSETSQTEEKITPQATVAKELTEREKADALSVANDQFTFDALVGQIGGTEEELSAFLGLEETSESYTTEVFGEDVVITTISEENSIQSLKLVFADTNIDSLFIAISEQLGQDGQDTENVVTWVYEENNVVLSQDKSGCIVEISQK